MKLKRFKRVPALIALGVMALVCLLRLLGVDLLERLELMTYDMRVRQALRAGPTVATNLGFVFIDEESVRRVADRSLGYSFGLYWPRQIYGRLVQELAAQGAKAVALDVILRELRPDHDPVILADNTMLESDEYFALQLARASNVIIAITEASVPPPLFLTNAARIGDISTDKDRDGILRRAKAFRTYRQWHPAFRQLASDPDFGVDLERAQVESRRIVLTRPGAEDIVFPLDEDGNFDLTDFAGENLPPGVPRRAKPFSEQRAWHMGVVLAAWELGLALENAEVDLPGGRIVLRGPAGVARTMPVDRNGYFYIDWCLPPNHPQLLQEPIQHLLAQHKLRLEGQTNNLARTWTGRLAIVGSSAVMGNDLTDRGATPLRADSLLVSKHWNVANSIITGRFVQRAPLGIELGLIIFLGLLAAVITLELRILFASSLMAAVILLYIALVTIVYVQTRLWLPLALPVIGAALTTHVCLVTWRALFEQTEQRRIKSIFSTMVSPKIVNELLKARILELGGSRREITVLFADVRGFTELTDSSQERAAEYIRANKLTGPAAEACFDDVARETLRTVNLYLGVVADTVLKQDGCLDKFIGDCVMAFWNAPTPNPRHAVACVRAAIDAQRAVYAMNQERSKENARRELENKNRAAAGLPPLPLLPVLFLGSGINTGMATVGLMGSEVQAVVRQGNYTVFGREVNLASRLESQSGRGRIYIGETTYAHLRRDDPELAATCLELPAPITLKGIRTAVRVFEVPWRPPGSPSLEEEFPTTTILRSTTAVEQI